MRCPALARILLPLLAAGWSSIFLVEALQRWRFERICAMTCGPFVEPELVEHYRRAFDWQTPLMLAALPLAALVVWRLLNLSAGLKRTRAA